MPAAMLPLSYYAYASLFNCVIFIAVSSFVLYKQPRSLVARLFALFTFMGAFWAWFYFLWLRADDAAQAEFLVRTCMIAVTLMPPVFFQFATQLTQKRVWRFVHIFNYLVAILVCATVYTPLLSPGVRQHLVFPFWPLAGPTLILNVIQISCSVVVALWFMGSAVIKSDDHSRLQLQIAFWAHMMGWFAAFFNYFPWFSISVPPLLNPLIGLYIIAIGYAIVRYQLLDIRVVITKTSLLLGVYLVVLGIPFLIGWWGQPWLMIFFKAEWWLVPLLASTVLATAGPFAYAYLRRQAEERLLSEQRRYQRTLQRASRGMTQVRNVRRLSKLITRIVSSSVRMTHASLFLWDKEQQRYVLEASHGPKRLAVQSRYGLEARHPLIEWLTQERRVLQAGQLDPIAQQAITREIDSLHASLIIPGLIERRLIGFLVLGAKNSRLGYSVDDLHAFTTLANEAAIAIENAISYEELIKLNEQLKAASERLVHQERLVAAGQFASGMMHEIKNPLSAIKTFAQYLPERYADAAFREKFFRIVQAEIDRINGIVKELSDFAKPAPLSMRPVLLAQLVDDTITLLSDQCLKQKIELRCHSSVNGLAIQADPQQLKQVLLNLVLNSMEAMNAKGGTITLELAATAQHARITLSDTGPGILPEHQQRIWDPFFTTKERGMGLGLAIVRGIVERHGGHIQLASSPGRGTTIDLSLPVSS